MKREIYIWLIMSLLTMANGCTINSSPPQESDNIQRLRISNIGNEDIQNFFVLFPGDAAFGPPARVYYPSVPAGGTTEYRAVPGGVYRYGGYEYTMGNTIVHQSAVDFVGEEPLSGTSFTYEILLDLEEVQGAQIQLVQVINDDNRQ